MRKYKHYILVLFCGMLSSVQTVHAQWLVFDFTEAVPIFKDVKDGVETIKDLKNQLNVKNLTLGAIGKEMNSFASFGKGLKIGRKSGGSSGENTVETVKSGEDNTRQATSDASTAATSTVNTQKDITNDYIDQTQKMLDGRKLSLNSELQPFQISENTIIPDIVFEEEEEEEEWNVSAIEEEINVLQASAMSEQKQLAVELNDVLDAQLAILNKSAQENENALKELSATIWQIDKLSQDNKETLQDKITQIAERQRGASDWAIKIVESVKENYNKEYSNKIKDGMNNYTKVVIAYIRGDATREDVTSLGDALKRNISTINVTPDMGVLDELYKKMADIRSEVENLVSEVNRVLENT